MTIADIAEILDEDGAQEPPVAPADLDASDPALIVFTSGTTGEPRGAVHGQRYLPGQAVQAKHWFGPEKGELAWCTAASGWSKSSRNSFLAAWLCGAAALLHDGRFDPAERLDLIEREGVNVLCQAPTEYRMLAKRGEAASVACAAPARLGRRGAQPRGDQRVCASRAGLEIHDGYGQTETGRDHRHGARGARCGDGSMGRPLPGIEMRVTEDRGAANCRCRQRAARASSAATSAKAPPILSTASGGRQATRSATTATATSASRAATTT